jgi:hypothetical protein
MPAVPDIFGLRPHVARCLGNRLAANHPDRDPASHPGQPSSRIIAHRAGADFFPFIRFLPVRREMKMRKIAYGGINIYM